MTPREQLAKPLQRISTAPSPMPSRAFSRTTSGCSARRPAAEQGSFRWRGATVNHNFASGLDDYPRGVAPTEDDENVDLLGVARHGRARPPATWALVGAGPEAVQSLASDASAAESRLVSEHWDQSKRAFCGHRQPEASCERRDSS